MGIKERPKKIIEYLLKQDENKWFKLDEVKDKRSLEQNKLLWENLQKASKELGQDLMKTYCDLLEEADVKSEFIITAIEMEESLRKSFRGIQFIRKQEVNNKECFVYKVYIGSSKMTTVEMKELIERSFDLLSKLGIDYE